MRIWFCGAAILLALNVYGQNSTVVGSQRLQAIVQVQRDSVGANIVKISTLDPNYSTDILRKQVDAIGAATGSGARGVQLTANLIDAKDPSSRAIKATFAVDGLIDPKGGWVKIAPIVKALSGSEGLQGLANYQIDFDRERPTPQDLQTYSSPEVDIQSRVIDQSMEYTVLVKAVNPKGIQIPDFASFVSVQSVKPIKPQTDWFVILTIGVAISAVGALVYCLFLLKPSPKRPRK